MENFIKEIEKVIEKADDRAAQTDEWGKIAAYNFMIGQIKGAISRKRIENHIGQEEVMGEGFPY